MHFERQALLQLASRLRSELIGRSLDVPGESHIVPVITGSNASAVALAARLKDAGFHCMPVRPPTVPGKERPYPYLTPLNPAVGRYCHDT